MCSCQFLLRIGKQFFRSLKFASRLCGVLSFQSRLFDLQEDPYELAHVTEQHPDVAAELEEALKAQIEEQKARGKLLGAGGMRDLSAERQSGLEGLGYGGGDDDE